MSNSITTVTSERGFRARFELLARAGELSILGEPIPEVTIETSRGGYGATTRAHAERAIARLVRRGWKAVTWTADGSEVPSDDDPGAVHQWLCHGDGGECDGGATCSPNPARLAAYQAT